MCQSSQLSFQGIIEFQMSFILQSQRTFADRGQALLHRCLAPRAQVHRVVGEAVHDVRVRVGAVLLRLVPARGGRTTFAI